jgi:hypothetical protein
VVTIKPVARIGVPGRLDPEIVLTAARTEAPSVKGSKVR